MNFTSFQSTFLTIVFTLSYQSLAVANFENANLESRSFIKRISEDFFDCSKKIINNNKEKFSSSERLLTILDKVKVVKTSLQNKKLNEHTPLTQVKSKIWISAAYFDKLSRDQKCEIETRAAMNQLNLSSIMDQVLSSDEIEIATRWLLNKSEPNDNLELVISKLNSVHLTIIEYQKIYTQQLDKYNQIASKLRYESSNLSLMDKHQLELEMWDHFRKASEANKLANNN